MQDNAPQIPNIQKYHDHFRQISQSIKLEPKRNRSCNDKLCYMLFILITIAFLAIGLYFIRSSQIRSILQATLKNEQYSDYVQYVEKLHGYNLENLKPGIPIIVGMMALSFVMAVLFLCLLVRFPACVFVVMLVLGVGMFAAVTGLLFYAQAWLPAVVMCVLFVLLVVVLCCTFKKIRIGLVLLKIASRLLIEKPSIFLAPIFVMIFIISFQSFWVLGLAGITIYKGNATTQPQIEKQKTLNTIFSILWTFFNLFYSFFFYYCISFLIATAAGIWYYNQDENYLTRGVGRILRYHVGSFTFASLLVTLVSVTRQYTEKQARSGFSIATVCICMLACCIKCMEDLLQTLNHNSIITMSITGESYFDSARTTLSLIFDNFPLFFLVDLMSHMVTMTGVVFICGLPAVIGFILLRGTAENPDDTTTLIVGTVVIVLFGMLVGGVFLSVLSQALSCMFIFFCLDRKFVQMGFPAPERAPQEIKQIFNEMAPYVGGEYNEHLDTQKNQNAGYTDPNRRDNEPADPNGRGPEFY